jgi:transcriptional regulator with XRE-family HTH domain
MATVDYDRVCRDDFDDSGYNDPRAVADTEHSDVARAEFDADTLARERRALRSPTASLHRIAEVRQRQGVTLRNVARRLGMSLAVVRHQEQPECDMRISDLLRWQQVLEVPVAELLVEGDDQLSGPVLERSRMVKLMKTAAAIRERTEGHPVGRMVTMLIEQILEIMPELSDVTPWHAVGQRRTLDEVGRTGRTMIDESVFRRGSGS